MDSRPIIEDAFGKLSLKQIQVLVKLCKHVRRTSTAINNWAKRTFSDFLDINELLASRRIYK